MLRAVLGLALACIGCGTGDDPNTESPPPAPPLLSAALVSEPLVRETQVSAQEGTAYVSLPPGTFPGGLQATIRNPANGRQEIVQMVDGGWDPVPIAAEAGDTLRILIHTEQSGIVEYLHLVPPARPPVIVRTDPPRRKRDVPLNTMLLVVFSEPIDPSSVTPQRVQLLRDGQPVGAGLEISADGLRIAVHPQSRLAPGTDYVLVVSSELADLNGDRLEQGVEVEFTTGTSVEDHGLAFVWGGSVFAAASAGSERVLLVSQGTRPVWSPDGTRLAFTRPADNSLGRWQVCIAQADGTGVRCATGQADGVVTGGPSWSPDGAMLAFSFFTYDCPGGQCGQVGGYSSSLTLLNTTTMQIETLPTPPVGAVSWSPDGRKIAGTFGGGGVGTVNPDGSGLEMLAQSQQGVSVTEVAWSPDGGRLALAAWSRVCPWYCNTAISIINADGTRLRLIARAEAARDRYLWSPAWSADGNYLAYTLSRGDCAWDNRIPCGSDIVVAEAESGQFKFMVRSAGSPSWRP